MTGSSAVGPSEGGDIVVERRGGVAILRIDRPDEANRITPESLAQLGRIAAELARDDGVQAVLVTGTGTEHFSMGILNPVLRAQRSKAEILELVRLANDTYDALAALPQIVVAAINGNIRAGAAELALACDIRLVARHARLCFPEALWGGFPGAGGPVRLPAIIGADHALELIATGREIDAEEMARLGFATAIHDGPALMPAAEALAARIAASGPLATRGAKRIAREAATSGPEAAMALAWKLRQALEWSADVDEGIAAHREGRAPRFTGR